MNKGPSTVFPGFHSSCLSSVLLLFALLPLAVSVHVAQSQSSPSTSTTCGSIQNQYNNTVNAGGRILIVTTVPTACVTYDYNQIIVDILQPNTARILSTAPASNGVAVNTVTAPATTGPLNLTVRVSWLNYPVAGTLASYETTITIMVNGSVATSKVTLTTASTKPTSSTRMSSIILSSTTSSVEVINSTVLQYTVIVSKNATSTTLPPTVTVESTPTASSTLFTTPSSNPLLSMLSLTGAEILVAVAVILAVAVFVWKRRR